jgi:hypothetical protein
VVLVHFEAQRIHLLHNLPTKILRQEMGINESNRKRTTKERTLVKEENTKSGRENAKIAKRRTRKYAKGGERERENREKRTRKKREKEKEKRKNTKSEFRVLSRSPFRVFRV